MRVEPRVGTVAYTHPHLTLDPLKPLNARIGPNRRTSLAVFAVVSAALLAAAYLYYRGVVNDVRRTQYETISAIGAYKAEQIHQWRLERLTDARQIAASVYFRRGLAEYLRDPARTDLLRGMETRLRVERTDYANDGVFLVSPGGRLLVAVGDSDAATDSSEQRVMRAALASQDAVISDFFRHGDGSVYVAAAAAVRDVEGATLAIAVLRTNVAHYLYPLVRSWPTPSRTGETNLLQREGDSVVWVNSPHMGQGLPLLMRMSLARTEVPAVQAVLGARGMVQGPDYRGVAVLADVRDIRESPWFMIAKVDEAEIFAAARERAGFLGITLASLILLTATGLAWNHRRSREKRYRLLYEAELRQHAAEELYRTTLYSIGDAVITTGNDGRVQAMNHVAERLTGWQEAEAHGKVASEIFCVVNAATRVPVSDPVREVLRSGAVVELAGDSVLIARDGREHPIADSAAPIRDAAGTVSGAVLVFTDQSKQRAAQMALAESEERWKFALEGAGEGVWDWNLVTEEAVYSRRWKEMLGYADEDIGTGFAEFRDRVVTDDLPQVLADIEAHRSGRTPAYASEFRMRCKDGGAKWIAARGIVTARDAEGLPVRMIGTHADITEHKRRERLLETRVRLSEFSTAHTLDELIQETLDEAERLTGSSIGFWHFVDADQNTLTLQTWSKNTVAAACTTEGKGRHAPVDAAGVWVDCVRERRPVIHNDYPALAHRKGMPAGHAPVAREAIIPLIRDDRIMAVFGVGNKPSDYDQQDVAALVALGDLCWEVISRKHVEESLRTSETHLSAILESTADGVLAVDTTGKVVKTNARFADMWRIPPALLARGEDDELLAHVLGQLSEPEEFLAKVEALYRSDAVELDTVTFKDGRVFERSTSPMIMRGEVTGRVWSFRDITERRVADAALQLQGAALNVAANPMVITDRTGRVEWVNAAFTSVTGFGADEAIGQELRVLTGSGVHDNAFYARLWETILAGGAWHGEMTNRRKDGSWYPDDVTITPVKDAHGHVTHCIAITRDLTQEKAQHAQFLQAQKMESVGRLAGGIAHDFNNLLTVITNTVDIISEEVRPDDPLRADLEEIQQAGERAASLTRQLLAFSRREVLKPELVQLSTMVAGLRPMLQRLIGEDVEIVFESPAPTGCVRADIGQIEQVLLNLVVNARDAMPDGGTLTIEARDVDVDDAQASVHESMIAGPYVMLSVRDTGIGMDKATRLQIFEPFFTTKGQGQGTGLGLATVYGIVHQSGGTISVESALGKGTTFTFYLPRVAGDAAALRPGLDGRVHAGSETILIVEDEAPVLRTSTRILRSAGYTVLTASDGMEALRVLEGHKGRVDLVLTDVVMPGVGGRELAGWLADLRPEIKILFTSGYTDDAILRHGVLDRSAHFISKPYKRTTLTRKIREVLDAPSATPQPAST